MKFISRIHHGYYALTAKASIAVSSLFSPLLALADNPPNKSPWQIGINYSDGKLADDTWKFVEKILTYAGIGAGALILIGGAIYIWQSVNMPREEKEHHNIPLRILMGVVGVVVGLAMVAFLVSGLNSSS